jgi:hypothetical protein
VSRISPPSPPRMPNATGRHPPSPSSKRRA